jgi:hypothetical protein
MHASTPDQGQDSLNELAAASVGLQHVRQARAVVPGALQKEAGRQDFLSLVPLTQTNFGGDDAGGGSREKRTGRCSASDIRATVGVAVQQYSV